MLNLLLGSDHEMTFRLSSLLFLLLITRSYAQERTISLGIYTGATTTYSWDEGVTRDPRYETRYDVKLAPVGISYGVDYNGYGFVLTPGLINIGQKYNVINTVGGQEGIRKATLQYLNLPVAFKVHIIDLSFFKVSALIGGSAAILLNARESISHRASKLRFPSAVYPILPADYEVEYDGVVSPAVNNYTMLGKTDYRSLQIFADAGFRSDWDITDEWRVSFDFRVCYGIFEPRTSAYMDRLNTNQTLYDLPGARRDLYASLTVGIARYIEIDKKSTAKKKNIHTPSRKARGKNPWPEPRRKKPKS
jgi:hypothetical protein